MNKSIAALALGTFALGIAEFVIMGILGSIADEFGVSISRAGHFISAYSTGVAAGAPFLILARKLSLKKILLILASFIIAGNLLAAVSTGYHGLLAARFISGLPHGGYFGVVAIVAARISEKGREAYAMSMAITGMTVANIIGVPLGTLFSTFLSWRLTFAFIALSGVATLLLIMRWIPDVGKVKDTGFRGQFRFLRTLAPWLIVAGTLMGQTGLYCWYSYIEPLMCDVSGFDMRNMSWLMALAGIGMFIGNLIGGKLSERYSPPLVASLIFGTSAVTLLLIYFTAQFKTAAVFLMMLGAGQLFAPGGPLQTTIVKYSKGGELLGGTTIQMAYNVGNAVAAWIGGAVIAAGYGYRMPAIVGIPFVLAGFILLFVMYRKYER